MYGEQLLCISIHVIQSELNYNITVCTIDKIKKIQKNVSVKILVLCYVDKNIGWWEINLLTFIFKYFVCGGYMIAQPIEISSQQKSSLCYGRNTDYLLQYHFEAV